MIAGQDSHAAAGCILKKLFFLRNHTHFSGTCARNIINNCCYTAHIKISQKNNLCIVLYRRSGFYADDSKMSMVIAHATIICNKNGLSVLLDSTLWYLQM